MIAGHALGRRMSVQAAFDHAVAEFTATAVSTLYFYDVLLTWDDEVGPIHIAHSLKLI